MSKIRSWVPTKGEEKMAAEMAAECNAPYRQRAMALFMACIHRGDSSEKAQKVVQRQAEVWGGT